MSIPYNEFRCTACDYSETSLVATGRRVYRVGPVEAPIRYSLGLCEGCSSVVAMERMPDKDLVAAAKAIRLDEPAPEPAPDPEQEPAPAPWPRSLIRRLFGSSEPPRPPARDLWDMTEAERLAVTGGVAVLEGVLGLERSPVCLSCGDERVSPLDVGERGDEPRPWRRLGRMHPGCGGELEVRWSGRNDRIAPVERVRVYNVHGEMIDQRLGWK